MKGALCSLFVLFRIRNTNGSKKNYIIILKNKKVKLSNFNRIGDI